MPDTPPPPPRCFISYSWDSEDHKEWVRELATRLRECGVDAVLDQFHCKPGMDLTRFMEMSIRESSYVLLVCTPNFARKADAGVGGVGYEKTIVTGEIFAGEAQETKFVPLLREGNTRDALPSYLMCRLFIDFRDYGLFEDRLEELARHIHGEPIYTPPPIRPKPDWNKPVAEQNPNVFKPAQKPKLTKSANNPQNSKKIENSIGMTFVLIPPGVFMMGSHMSPEAAVGKYGGEKKWFKREHPQREVTIKTAYYLQSTPVTQGQWKSIFDRNPSYFREYGEECPVEMVSFEMVQGFIRKLNQIEGANTYRLPTEAEWEYACRSGTNTEFSFGNDPSELGEYAWYFNNAERVTHPVATKKPNLWGLYDMHGNVWEWVEDSWHHNYYNAPTDGSAWITEPTNTDRMIRGGGCFSSVPLCRTAYRARTDSY